MVGWKLVWSDEFNYAGDPDPPKWGYEGVADRMSPRRTIRNFLGL